MARLRPSPDKALILVDFHVDIDQAVNETVPKLNRILEEDIHPPVRATQSGFASISRALQTESISASERGELIAIPILLIVLLLVFRSPIAAAIPLGFGAITVFASRGILYLLTSYLGIDAFALTVTTMMGLALGVDYSLLMVSRFREELAAGATPLDAAWATRRTAGRTCVFAGSTLLISMVVALFIVPGALLAGAGWNGGDGRRAQRPRRDGGRPGVADADRPQPRPLADRTRTDREIAADGLRPRRDAPPGSGRRR